MSTFNDTESVTTLSEMNSICGDTSIDKDKKISLLEEKIRQMMEAEKLAVQPIPPCWMTKETEAVEQCLDEFRVAFNEAKQFILEKRVNEDTAEDYEELKKASQVTDEVKEVWMSASRDVKKQLGGITDKLNDCCGNNNVGKQEKQTNGQLWMNVILPNISGDALPVLNATDVLPAISAETIKICEGLVGAWKFDYTNHTCPDNITVPSKFVISLHSSGFFLIQRQYDTVGTLWACFRPDGKRYQIKGENYWDRQCTINDNQILCRRICIDDRTQDCSFRLESENRIEYTFKNSGSFDGTYSYIADMYHVSVMSTFNDTLSVTTLSEMNSICGDSTVDWQKEVARLQEEIRRMKVGKPSQPIPPCWITKETEAVEQCLDEFRVAFNEAKQCLIQKRENEDISEDYEDNKKAAQLTEEVKSIWMFAARDVKKHLGGITQKLNRCCGNITVEKPKTVEKVEEQIWMNVDLSGIPPALLPVINPTDVVPDIDPEAIKICKGLVGTWKFDTTNRPCPDTNLVPIKFAISFNINSGFFNLDFQRKTESIFGWFRPDGKRYNLKKNQLWYRKCTINDNQIVCSCICSDDRTQDYAFRYVSENRIEYTFNHSKGCSYDGTYAYIADV